MASKIVSDEIKSPQNAKAWVNFDGTGTPNIRTSYNVSSITDNAVGDWTVNFATPMANADYTPVVSGATADTGAVVAMASLYPYNSATSAILTGSFRVKAIGSSGATTDLYFVTAVVFA